VRVDLTARIAPTSDHGRHSDEDLQRLSGVADGQLAAPPMLLDQDVGGDIRGIAFSPDGATLWVAAGPPVGKVIRFAVAVSP